MKIFTKKEKEIRKELVEMYMYYFKQARKLRETGDPDERKWEYETAKADGAVEAVAAIFLNIYGTRETYNLWQVAQAACEHDEMEKTG